MSSVDLASLDGLTLDAMGTLVELVDPVEPLRSALTARGVVAEPAAVREAFAAEVAYYLPRAHEGSDEASLASLAQACAGVFLDHLGAELDHEEFAPAFVGALAFRPLPAVLESLVAFRAAGLTLACVSNWDASLSSQLEGAGLGRHLDAIVSSAEAGAAKPDPAPIRLALDRLGVSADRALHVGDDGVDEDAAKAAGVRFAPAPLETLPARLGLEEQA